MSTALENERSGPREKAAPMLKEFHPQDTTTGADGKPLDMPAKRPTIAEVIAAKKAKAAPADHAEDTDKPGTTQAAVSLFKRANLPTPCGVVSIRDFVRQVQDGTHAPAVAKVRQEVARVQASDLTPEQRKQAVNKVKLDLLPAISLSGCVTSGGRAKAFEEGRFTHSGFLQLDFDAKDMNGAKPEAVRDRTGADPHIHFAALSPTGEGVKAIMRIPVCKTPGEHLAAFKAAEAYMLATYGLQIDKATKDPSRVCYVTHDPQATWNDATVPLPVPEPQELPQQPAATSTAPRQGLILRETHSPREITAEDVGAMLAVLPPRPEYPQWLRIASAVWDAVGESTGTALLNAWSPEESPGEYAAKFKDRLTEVHAGTLVMLAKEHGWTPEPRQQPLMKTTKDAVSAGKAPSPDECRAILAERAFDAATVPQRPIPILLLGDKVISTPGNLTNVQALAKAGKTGVIEAITAAMFNGNRQGADTLGFSADNSEARAVLHFDTEQSRFDHGSLIRRAMTRARVDTPPPWFRSYCITDLTTDQRQQVISYAVEDAAAAHGGIFAIIIDGVADICRDPNNPEEAFGLVDGLHAGAIKHDCAIITVLHENPGSETGKMRGHLGSQLERKAETPLRLAKDPGSGITTIWTDRARHCHIPKEKGTCFSWSDTLGMHVSRGSAGEIKASEKRQKFSEEAEAAFGDATSLSYSALVEGIMQATGLKSPKTAEKRVTTYQAEGIVTKSPGGSYTLKS
jgi:hypothetical protein